MTLFNVAWEDVMIMPINALGAYTAWRVKYEEEKQRVISEEVDKQKNEMKRYNTNKTSPSKNLLSYRR